MRLGDEAAGYGETSSWTVAGIQVDCLPVQPVPASKLMNQSELVTVTESQYWKKKSYTTPFFPLQPCMFKVLRQNTALQGAAMCVLTVHFGSTPAMWTCVMFNVIADTCAQAAH